MERRFKVAYISVHEVSAYGKNFPEALKKKLPENTAVLDQETDINTACLKILIYNPIFPEIELGKNVGKLKVEIGLPESSNKPKLIYSH